MLGGVAFLQGEGLKVVRHHHERWDGTGYPERLHGEEIPLGARIIFVVDAYDAMTSDRVYRGRLSPGEALEELERCAGTQFDPRVVDALLGSGVLGSLVAALLDWPRQWEDFRIHPERIFAPDPENLIVKGVHGGRPHSMDIEVEAEIVFVFHVPHGVVTRWDMFLTVEEALSRAAERSGHERCRSDPSIHVGPACHSRAPAERQAVEERLPRRCRRGG
jgi:hypothetical protein